MRASHELELAAESGFWNEKIRQSGESSRGNEAGIKSNSPIWELVLESRAELVVEVSEK